MGDFQFWIYIIIGAIYLLSRFFKKAAQKQEEAPDFDPGKPARRFEQPPAKPAASPSKALTFEDLLREITESKTPPKPEVRKDEYVNYDEEIGEEEQDLEDVNYNYKKDNVASAYDAAREQSFTRSSLEETMRLEDTDIKFGKFKVFEKDKQSDLINKYLADFYDPEGLKKAIVMGEILQTKF